MKTEGHIITDEQFQEYQELQKEKANTHKSYILFDLFISDRLATGSSFHVSTGATVKIESDIHSAEALTKITDEVKLLVAANHTFVYTSREELQEMIEESRRERRLIRREEQRHTSVLHMILSRRTWIGRLIVLKRARKIIKNI